MSIIKQIKIGFSNNPAMTIFRLMLYPFVFVVILLCILLIVFCVTAFNLSIKSGVDAFEELIGLSF